MSYTVKDLDHVIEDEANDWEGSWDEFFEATSNRLVAVLDEAGNPVREKSPHGNWYNTVFTDKGWRGAELPGIGIAEHVDDFGGEGQGDDYWFVFKVVDADGNERLFKRNGWYASFDGGYYEGPTEEVEEAVKQVTYYAPIKSQ